MYDSIYDRLYDDGSVDAMLSLSLIMANKYGYAKACYDVYEILTTIYSVYGLGEDSIDDITLQMANEYLEKSKMTKNVESTSEKSTLLK